MAPSTIRKAIGTVKDQTSIGIAKVAGNMAPELEVAVVKATSHNDDPAGEKYIREILHLTSHSRGHVSACVLLVSKRLGKTRDWIVALKSLMLIHRLINDGGPVFQQEIMYATRRGTRLLNMSDFKDEAHSSSWDHSAFVRTYALYLDQRLEVMCFERKLQNGEGGEEQQWRSPQGYGYGELRDESVHEMRRSRSSGDVKDSTHDCKDVTPVREMKLERVFGKISHLQRLLDRFLSSRPTGLAKNERMILVALYPMVKESFKLYADVCDVLAVLLDKFFDMEQPNCVKAFDAYANAAKQIDELIGFYNWCKDIGVARSSEFPEIQRISSKLLGTLEEFVRNRSRVTKSPERIMESQPAPPDMNEIKALPPPENYTPPPPPPQPVLQPEPPKPVAEKKPDLVDLREEGVTADDQGNKFALALFAGPAGNNTNGSWEAFNESGKADWELALVESTSHLSDQKAAMGGGLDPLLLNGMYDQGIITQHTTTAQLSGGSASSVALPGPGKSKTPVLALPAPDGTVQTVGQDPFAASLTVPPPSYVQMADLEKKQQFLAHEQMLWQQYAQNGMQGQMSLAKISTGAHGMQPPPAGYYYTTPY